MPAKFYTDAEIIQAKERAVVISAKHVEAFYSEVSPEFGRALFFTCMRTWGSSPAITCALLNSTARSQIINAWRWSEQLAGVLLKKQGFEFTRLFLQTDKLAATLTVKGDLWVDFREIRKELGL